MPRRPVLLFVLLAFALLVAACGDDDNGDQSPTAILQETFGESKDVKSGRLDASLRINAKGIPDLPEPVTLALRGPFQSSGGTQLPRFDFEVDITTGGQSFKAGAVSTGDKGFVKFMEQAYAVPDQLFKQFRDGYAEQARCVKEQGDDDQASATFRALGIDPRRWLSDARVEGTEDVGGASATRIVARVDVPKFLEDVNRVIGRTELSDQQRDPCAPEGTPQRRPSETSRQLSAEQRKDIADAIKDARIDIWTGEDDRILRRLNVALQIESKDRKQTGDVRLDLTIGGLNEDQQVRAPQSARPLEELVAQFGGQIPGVGSGEAQPESGGEQAPQQQPETGGEQAPPPSSEYERCLADAGPDVQKLQQCADLIGS